MGILADSALEAGGEIVGVMPRSLVNKEVSHSRLSELGVVGSMHERNAQMAELSDAFIALPEGYGTLVVRNSERRRLLRSAPGAIRPGRKGAVSPAGSSPHGPSDSCPESLVKRLLEYGPHLVEKWSDLRQT
jgi:hypothetical protein